MRIYKKYLIHRYIIGLEILLNASGYHFRKMSQISKTAMLTECIKTYP